MRQAVRSLGWAISIFWIVLLLFTITVVYSASLIRPSFGEPSMHSSNGTFTVSLPLTLYNGGFYDISVLNITTRAMDYKGSLVISSTTLVPLILGGASATLRHNMSIAIEQAATSDLSHLLFMDSEFEVDTHLRLVYAKAFPFEISFNMSMPWGAPFANLTLGEIVVEPMNITHFRTLVPVSFENNSFLEMNGTLGLEIVDYMNNVVGVSLTPFDALPGSPSETTVEILVSGNPANIREARLSFETPYFSYGPMVMPLV
jgi:hypothetical protein